MQRIWETHRPGSMSLKSQWKIIEFEWVEMGIKTMAFRWESLEKTAQPSIFCRAKSRKELLHFRWKYCKISSNGHQATNFDDGDEIRWKTVSIFIEWARPDGPKSSDRIQCFLHSMKDEGWRMKDEGWRWRMKDEGWRMKDVNEEWRIQRVSQYEGLWKSGLLKNLEKALARAAFARLEFCFRKTL